MRNILRALLAISTIILSISCAVQEQSITVDELDINTSIEPPAENALNSTEYKLLLNPEKFKNYQKGLQEYWKIVEQVAVEQGIPVILEDNPLKLKHKQVTFYDTPEHDLKEAGFLFRQRQKFKKQKPTTEFDYVLKYVQSSLEAVENQDMSVDSTYLEMSEGVEIEADIVYDFTPNGEIKTKFTISNSFDIDHTIDLQFANITKIYPVLSDLGIAGNVDLQRVANLTVDQWKIGPGSLDFGDGLIVEMDFTAWLVPTATDTICIPEFSYDHGYSDDPTFSTEAMTKCYEFMSHVNASKPDWVIAGRSKSAFLYEL